MKKLSFVLFLAIISGTVIAQTNMTVSNPLVLPVLLGNYNPADYTPTVIINYPDSILLGIVNRCSKDTLVRYLSRIDTYHNRNSGSDTVSGTNGIGAVRRWIYGKFLEYSAACNDRLLVSWMDFDGNICGQHHHRNIFGVLPGLDTTDKEVLFIEAHFDTRCEGVCDTACYSPGMEDNGSGTVLVMELARIMTRYAYNHTIVFALVTGEDQGLFGSTAFSQWLKNNNIKLRAVLNNDVIGGFICGQTSSPPGCPGLNAIDSTHVRVFSFSSYNDSTAVSPYKQLARYIRLHQEERINPLLTTPMTIDIIITEDRVGRSGDQVPFRQRGYTAIRFTSRNEHGNGTGTPPDRQHSVRDILGVDLTIPPDGIVDSFFVDPGYLRRNLIMNGVNLGWLAIAPPMPQPEWTPVSGGIGIDLHGADSVYQHYRVGLRTKRSGTLYFDTVYTFYTNHITINGLAPNKTCFFSVANVKNGVESQFCNEFSVLAVGQNQQPEQDRGIRLLPNTPNPFSEGTRILVEAGANVQMEKATIVIRDIMGRQIQTIPVQIIPGLNTVEFTNSKGLRGIYIYSLCDAGHNICSGKMAIY
ncbi:MAG TPA: M28 family peptidase [Bacteroidales bacterium]|nr:M28 family peptidase [Bacteroidales bacterium]